MMGEVLKNSFISSPLNLTNCQKSSGETCRAFGLSKILKKGGYTMAEARELTQKQKRFCDEYLIDLNATQAAIRAGYSKKYANTNASKLLQITIIKQFIETRMAEKESQLIASQDEVLQYLTSVLRGETQSEIVVVEGTGDGCSEARQMQKAPDEKERLKAAELLGRRYNLFTDKINVGIALPVVISGADELED